MFSPVELALAALLVGAARIAKVDAHMANKNDDLHPSVYGIGPDWTFPAGDLFDPLGPGVADQDDWWFRGPATRALAPQNGSVMELPAGGSVDIEIACNYAFSSYGPATSDPNDPLSACPSGAGASLPPAFILLFRGAQKIDFQWICAGPYHSGNPNASVPDPTFISGCALGIADKDDIENVGWDDLAIFSVNHNCVAQRITTFEVHSGTYAILHGRQMHLLANNGTANFYMTAFDCAITNVDPTLAAPILPVVDPVWCAPGNTTCQPAAGAKRPLYAYNTPTNVVWEGNNDRPGYHAEWSFPNDGAQNDIFDLSGVASYVPESASPLVASPDIELTRFRHFAAPAPPIRHLPMQRFSPRLRVPPTTFPRPPVLRRPPPPRLLLPQARQAGLATTGRAGRTGLWAGTQYVNLPRLPPFASTFLHRDLTVDLPLALLQSDTAAALSANPLGRPLGRRAASAASAGPKQHSSLAGAAVGLVGAVVAAMLVIA
ncbi:SPOSA6832_03495 [Sporobolomyces salmonicolor]|uniref:SPOSA6832_03495-mRNA-1:cds n=1 Tax=Sporidiobolus salmonicolor TaxID=5005 RepID=A0A0D6EPF2_SPOSA|nr:SPOSA6832_03495 [Sporobolomyces salmonicolor]